MSNEVLMHKIIELRKRKGFSQELLAENSGLNLRTIQRIEKGETIPRGDTLRKLASAFDVSPEEFSDWTYEENNGYLASLNISALAGLFFPVLGILLPLIFWLQKKDKVQGVRELGRRVLNFQFTLTLLLFLCFIAQVIIMTYAFDSIQESDTVSPNLVSGSIKNGLRFFLMALLSLNVINIIMILFNSIRINKRKRVFYPSIPFIKS
ncbi:DUF4870 domain-containing protein [Roseivirga misakiensis]|uniref:HTH cro/C1-type domain-containing protein n=1 Tax=Roseivirga misakiensis TaxID=1563681 RepID=A0A1E5SYX1_9BACT|nr:DUF4870 domain-containing protein [Roseivirga misakiensis]OEK04305.1 hypothetical protein BFP71_12545 [Roseivirga misakiensis]